MSEDDGSIDQEMTSLAIFLLVLESFVFVTCICCCYCMEFSRIIPFAVDIFYRIRKRTMRTHDRLEDEMDEEGDEDPQGGEQESDREKIKNQKRKKKKKNVEDHILGMTSIIFMDWFTVLSSLTISVFRLIAFLFVFGFSIADYINQDYFFLLTYQHLTLVSFTFLGIYYFFSTIYSLIHLISSVFLFIFTKKNEESKVKNTCLFFLYYLEYVILMLFEMAFVSSQIVTLAFWFLDVPTQISLNQFHIGVFTIPLHGMNSLLTLVEVFVLYRMSFHLKHIFFVSAYPWFYSILVTIMVKTKLIDEFPYNVVERVVEKFKSKKKKKYEEFGDDEDELSRPNEHIEDPEEVELDDFEALAVGMTEDVDKFVDNVEIRRKSQKQDEEDMELMGLNSEEKEEEEEEEAKMVEEETMNSSEDDGEV